MGLMCLGRPYGKERWYARWWVAESGGVSQGCRCRLEVEVCGGGGTPNNGFSASLAGQPDSGEKSKKTREWKKKQP